MNKEDLEKTLKHFHKHKYESDDMWEPKTINHNYYPAEMKGYFYHPETDFCITILEDGDKVYQVGTEADTIGIELETYEDLETRYESFTGEDL